jgi:hypothetical protein
VDPTRQPPLAEAELVGTWRLADYYTRDANGGVGYPLGPGALGLLVYAADGHMAGCLMRAGRTPFSRPRAEAVDRGGTDDEVRQAFDDYFGYAGRFRFDEATSTVHHHVEICSTPGWDGRETVRTVVRNPDQSLTYITPPRIHEVTEQRAFLVWHRE